MHLLSGLREEKELQKRRAFVFEYFNGVRGPINAGVRVRVTQIGH